MRFPVLLLLFCFLVSSFLRAQTPISIPYQNNPPLIDGLMNDWDITKSTGYQCVKFKVSSPNYVRWQLGYDELHLYGYVEVHDQQLIRLTNDASGSPRVAFNDAFELYVDTKHDSHNQMDVNDFQVIMNLDGKFTAFRGGDRFLLQVEKYRVPKDTMTAQFVAEVATKVFGTINNNQDIDSMWVAEFRIPWATLGITEREDYRFKLDLCFEDADSLLDIRPIPDDQAIPNFGFESFTGTTNFGFPANWKEVVLTGHASAWKKFSTHYSTYWWVLVLLIGLVFLPSLAVLARQNYRLRQVLPKSVETDLRLQAAYVDTQKVVRKHTETSITEERLLIGKARELVSKNFEKDISPSDLAKELAVSLRQLQRIFKEELNLSPNDFLTTLKMEEAARLLRETSLTISEVAYAVGFNDPSYFGRVFRKYFGKSPKELANERL